MDRLRAAARRVSTVEQPSLFPGPQAARRQATPHTQGPPESILFRSAIAEKHIHHTEKVVSVAELSRELAMVQRHGTADPSAYAKPERELVHRGRWDREFDSGFAGDADATAGAAAAAPRTSRGDRWSKRVESDVCGADSQLLLGHTASLFTGALGQHRRAALLEEAEPTAAGRPGVSRAHGRGRIVSYEASARPVARPAPDAAAARRARSARARADRADWQRYPAPAGTRIRPQPILRRASGRQPRRAGHGVDMTHAARRLRLGMRS